MKRATFAAAVFMMAGICVAQSAAQKSEGVVPSSRTDFGTLCGVKDTSPARATKFVRSSAGKWSLGQKGSFTGKDMAARLWHESNWMVDLHDSPAATPAVIHTAQMCFDPQGRLTRLIDRYMDMERCRCMRFTSVAYAPDGKETHREVHYVDAMSGQEEQEPAAAKSLPAAWQYHRLDELPFYPLVQKK